MNKRIYSINGRDIVAYQYDPKFIKESPGVLVGQSYSGVDDYGNDLFEDIGYVAYMDTAIPLQPGVWILGPLPDGQYNVLSGLSADALFNSQNQ